MKYFLMVFSLLSSELFGSNENNLNKISEDSKKPSVLPVFSSHPHTPDGEVVFIKSKIDDLIDTFFDVSQLSQTIYLINPQK
jgi:hypothetical protein